MQLKFFCSTRPTVRAFARLPKIFGVGVVIAGLHPLLGQAATVNVGSYAALTGAIATSANGDTINLTNNITTAAEIAISGKGLTIEGNGYSISVPVPGLDASGVLNTNASSFRVFNISATGRTNTLHNVILMGGAPLSSGGAINNSGGILVLRNVTVTQSGGPNHAGGGIYNTGATAYLYDCNITRNAALASGGFLNMDGGTMFLERCTFSENRSTSSGGGGGGGENNNATLYANNCTFANNKSTQLGGGLNSYLGTSYIVNCTFVGNIAYGSASGGGIAVTGGSATLVNSLFAYNYWNNSGTYQLNDVTGAPVAYYSVFQSTTSQLSLSSVGTILYTGNSSGSDDSLFSGGASALVLGPTGTPVGSGTIYQPFLLKVGTLQTPTALLKSGSFDLGTGARAAYSSAPSTPVVGYYNGSSWVAISGSSVSNYEVTTDQNSVTRTLTNAAGAVVSTSAGLCMLKVNAATNGTVSGATIYGDNYPAGSTVTLTAIPASGYQFTEWDYVLGGSGVASVANPFAITLTTNVTLQPVFTAYTGFTVSYSGNGATDGTVPAAQVVGVGGSTNIAGPGSMVRSGYTFSTWNDRADGNGTDYATNSVYSGPGNLSLYAKWAMAPMVTVSVAANPANGGSITGGGSYAIGGTATLTATASNGWAFTDWNDGSTNNPYTITVPATDITYTANFAQTTNNISFQYTNSVQQYTVPVSGNYYILAGGAQGGSGEVSLGGPGTEIEGSIYLTAGTTLNLVVGGSGFTGNFGTFWGGGGGGGSFVWVAGSSTPLLVAGGGGGANFDGPGGTAAPAYQEFGFNGDGPGGGAGGTNGFGGQGGTGDNGQRNGGGGGGWYGNGTAGEGTAISTGQGSAGLGGYGAFSFAGGAGGADDPINGPWANGGYGGGGGGGYQGGGGGGGYSGGGGGDGTGDSGGAGGSYLDPSLTGAGFVSGGNQADGFVTIGISAIPIGPTTVTVTANANPSNGGSVTGGGSYTPGTNVLLTATASNGWAFTVWSDGSTNNPYTVTVPATNITYTANFAPVAPPTVTSVSPSTGPIAGGTSVTITGTGFTGATAVNFGATAATSFTVNSATSITATSPAGAAGTVDITVTTAGGTSATSAADQFTYNTLGILDHFAWSVIPSPQYVGAPFAVTVTAQDSGNNTVTGSEGAVSLIGRIGVGSGTNASIEDFETGIWPHAPWVGGGSGTLSSLYAHDGGFGILDPDWYYRTDINIWNAGEVVSCWVRPSSSADGRAYLGFAASAGGCWSCVAAPNSSQFIIQQNDEYEFDDIASTDQVWQADKWYKIAVVFQSTNSVTCNLYDSDGTTLLNSLSYTGVTGLPGGIAIRSFNGFSLDTITSGAGGSFPVSITPTNSGTFVNGVWTGAVTVLEAATNMYLVADDGSGHTGTSGVFTVIEQHTLTVISAHGGTSPGTILTNDGTALVQYVTNSPVVNGATQYVCTGATVVGNNFTQVSPTNVTLTLTNAATLTWQWQTQYLLATATNGAGSVTAGGWYNAGSNAAITATPAANWHFVSWSGATNGATINGAQITIPMNSAIAVTANFAINTETLTVSSAHGTPTPGTTTVNYGTPVTEAINSPVANGSTTQYVCTGATVAGNGFVQVSPTNVTLTLTNAATLTWQWKTNYLLTIVSTNGAVTGGSNGFYAADTVLPLTVTPAPGYGFSHWNVDGVNAGTNLPKNVTMNGAHTVEAVFALLFVNISSFADSWIAWTTNTLKGTVSAIVTISNRQSSLQVMLAPVWFEIPSNRINRLRYPTGVDTNTHNPYIDVSTDFSNLVCLVGNRDYALDPGETVTLSPIEVYGYQAPTGMVVAVWADPPANGGYTPPPSSVISGTVTKSGTSTGVPGVMIVASNGGGTTTTGSNGNYTLTITNGWSGTVTPSTNGIGGIFSPVSKAYSKLAANSTAQNYTWTPPPVISGKVMKSGSTNGVANVVLNFSGIGTVKTDIHGNYTMTVPYNWTGIVTPSTNGIGGKISPVSKAYSKLVANSTAQNYTWTAPVARIVRQAATETSSITTTNGFAQWALLHGLAGAPADLFDQLNGAGITYGAEYAFGANLIKGEPLMRLLVVNGVLTAEVPVPDPATLLDARETVEFTRYEGSAIWLPAVCLPPSATTPLTKQWFQPGTGDAADFRVTVRLAK